MSIHEGGGEEPLRAGFSSLVLLRLMPLQEHFLCSISRKTPLSERRADESGGFARGSPQKQRRCRSGVMQHCGTQLLRGNTVPTQTATKLAACGPRKEDIGDPWVSLPDWDASQLQRVGVGLMYLHGADMRKSVR